MVTLGELPLDPSKLINLDIFDFLWVYGALGNILISIVSNSHFGKRPGARDTTIFESHADPHIPNIGYMEVYQGLQALGGISSFFS